MLRNKNPLEVAPRVFRSYVLLFNIAMDIITERLGEEYVREGLDATPRQFWILMAAEEGPFNQATIAEILRINPNQMVREIDTLEGKGLIRRSRNRKNRREVVLRVTRKGKQLLARGYSGWEDRSARLFHPIPMREVSRVTDLAKALISERYRR